MQGLDPDQQVRIAEIAVPLAWDAGATVFREGDCDSVFYVVEAGRVAIEITLPGRGRVTILTVGPGEVFGWSSLFFQRAKTASARTVEPTRALALDAVRLRALATRTPASVPFDARILDVAPSARRPLGYNSWIFTGIDPRLRGAAGAFIDAGIRRNRPAGSDSRHRQA